MTREETKVDFIIKHVDADEFYNLNGSKLLKDIFTAMDEWLGSKSSWINIEDRLPEECSLCLVYDPREDCVTVCQLVDGIWWEDYVDSNGSSERYNPTHWQPLPQKP